MAIDSKAKRMSMLSFASPLAWGAHFEVDGAVDADDRANLLHLYGGIVAAVLRAGIASITGKSSDSSGFVVAGVGGNSSEDSGFLVAGISGKAEPQS